MRLLTFFLLIFTLSFLTAQDTIRLMHYNLLDYGNSGFCSMTTNDTDEKDAWLSEIIAYVRPDIFTVNELSEVTGFHSRILNEVMNQSGYADFSMAQSPNIANSYIVNQLYYNNEKFVLESQAVAQSEVRDIDVYSLYHVNERLVAGDTTFLHCIVAHLKAGTSSDDELQRELMTQNALDWLEANGRPGNYVFMGDFNFYDANEGAFQLMIGNNDPVFKFYDPVDEIGNWHNNNAYAQVHSQSTRSSQTGNCGASGGMDDRFDFILMNKTLFERADNLHYLEDTYWALGQDGLRLNGTIVDPPNSSLPLFVLDALFGMSDHLPIVMELVVEETLGVDDVYAPEPMRVYFNNPVKDALKLRFAQTEADLAGISLYAASGSTVLRKEVYVSGNMAIEIDISGIPAGFYILYIQSVTGSFSGKLMINP